MLSGCGILIEETLHLLSADNMGSDYLLHIIRTYGCVEGVVRDNLHDGAFLAESKAAGNNHVHFVGNAMGLKRSVEILNDLCAFGGLTAGTAAAKDLEPGRSGVIVLPDRQGFEGFLSDAFKGIW